MDGGILGNNLLITIGVLLVLGLFILSSNSKMLESESIAAENEYVLTATGIAQSIIEEAQLKAFDETTVSSVVTSRSSLTPPGGLGKDGGEGVPHPDTVGTAGYASGNKFDDVDDYHGYSRKVNTKRAAGFIAAVTVNYASETYPDSLLNSRTYCKTMVVSVAHPNVSRPVTLRHSFTY